MNRTFELLLWTLTPWALDGLSGFKIFTTLYGSVLWGFILALSLLRTQFKNLEFKRNTLVPLVFFAGLWFSYWATHLSEPSTVNSSVSLIQALLIWVHAGLLSASLGISVVYLGVIILCLARDGSLRKTSWDRRILNPLIHNSWFKIPSYESLILLSKSLSWVAFGTWALGTFIAFYKVIRLDSFNNVFHSIMSFKHPLSVTLFSLVLLGCSVLSWNYFKSWELRKKSLVSFVLTFLFMFVMGAYFFSGINFKNHTPFEVFLR